MDVHAPHEPIHNWRDFAIHLTIVTIGLFIALSLEGLIEHIHQRHLVRDARANLHQELEDNHQAAQQDLVYLQQDMDRTKANIDTIHKLIADPTSHASLSYTMSFNSPSDAAWTTAHDTAALGFMPYNEVQGYSDLYHQQALVTDQSIEIFHRQTIAMAPVFMGYDMSKLPPDQAEAMLHDTAALLIDLNTLKQIMQQLDAQYVAELKQ
jgi:hypothetical protein